MAYKFSTGSLRQGDIYYEDDRLGEPTYIDFGMDTISLRPSGSAILNVSASAVGIGITEPTSTLSVDGSVSKSIASVTGTTNAITVAHHTILMGSDDSDCSVQLPAASACTGRIYIFKRLAADGESEIRITPDGSDPIDGETGSWSLDDQYNILTIQSDGGKWWIINEVHMGH